MRAAFYIGALAALAAQAALALELKPSAAYLTTGSPFVDEPVLA